MPVGAAIGMVVDPASVPMRWRRSRRDTVATLRLALRAGSARFGPTPSVLSASLAFPMRHQPEGTTTSRADSRATRVLPSATTRRAPLGLGSGDRFRAFRGCSGSFKEGVLQPEKTPELQGSRSTKRVFQIT